MKIKQGMSSEEIIELFGEPQDISSMVCGTSEKWNCTTWKYENFWSGESASFTFSGAPGNFKLNHFDIDRN